MRPEGSLWRILPRFSSCLRPHQRASRCVRRAVHASRCTRRAAGEGCHPPQPASDGACRGSSRAPPSSWELQVQLDQHQLADGDVTSRSERRDEVVGTPVQRRRGVDGVNGNVGVDTEHRASLVTETRPTSLSRPRAFPRSRGFAGCHPAARWRPLGVAAENEMSFAEVVRSVIERIVQHFPSVVRQKYLDLLCLVI